MYEGRNSTLFIHNKKGPFREIHYVTADPRHIIVFPSEIFQNTKEVLFGVK